MLKSDMALSVTNPTPEAQTASLETILLKLRPSLLKKTGSKFKLNALEISIGY